MLDSVKISRRQSEIRQALAGLVAKDSPTEDETRNMEALDAEYRTNETRYRAALVAEDTERREAKGELETRGGREWAELVAGFELRQVALALDEGRQLDGRTAEVVQELRSKGGYRGVPVPWQALELRVGETIASGTPDPIQTRPIIDRLFPDLAAARMGAQMIAIDSGAIEWPVVTSAVAAGWADGELANVAGPTAFATTDKALKPEHNLGVQMKISRKALKQSGAALEDAVRRDMNSAVGVALDKAVFLGTGANGQPLGVITGAATYGITATAINAAVSWAALRAAVVRFMTANAAGSPGAVRLLIRPEVWAALDGALITNTAVSEWDRLTGNIPVANIAMSTNALAAPAGSPLETSAPLTTAAGGVAPIFVGTWGAVEPDQGRVQRRAVGRAAADRARHRRRDGGAAGTAGSADGHSVMLWAGAAGGLELRRQDDGSARLTGRFPYNATAVLSDGGRSGRPRKERFASRAFSYRVDRPEEEIFLLVGHSYDRPLASRSAGTLKVRDTDAALIFEAIITAAIAATSHGKDALALIGAGLALGLSPGFRIPPERAVPKAEEVEQEPERPERGMHGAIIRTILAALLYELSVVTAPAYPEAQVELRNWQPMLRPPAPVSHLQRWRA